MKICTQTLAWAVSGMILFTAIPSISSSRYDRGWMCRHPIYNRLLEHCGFVNNPQDEESIFAPSNLERGTLAYRAKCGENIFWAFSPTEEQLKLAESVWKNRFTEVKQARTAFENEVMDFLQLTQPRREKFQSDISIACPFNSIHSINRDELSFEESVRCIGRLISSLQPSELQSQKIKDMRADLSSYVLESSLSVEEEVSTEVLKLSTQDLTRFQNAVYRCNN